MTMIISIVHKNKIFMGADSRLTIHGTTITDGEEKQFQEYELYTKLHEFDENICITMWGDLTRIPNVLFNKIREEGQVFSNPAEAADYFERFLNDEVDYKTQEEIGFHIGGFDVKGKPMLHHVFYGINVELSRGGRSDKPEIRNHDHSNYLALYNGKYDITAKILNFMKEYSEEFSYDWYESMNSEDLRKFITLLIVYTSIYDDSVDTNIWTATIEYDKEPYIRHEKGSKDKYIRSLTDVEGENTGSMMPEPSGTVPPSYCSDKKHE